MDILRIYTDGGCSGNQESSNFGGWGAILEMSGHKKELWGGEADTTNNRMELTAVIEALKALKRVGLHIHVFSDARMSPTVSGRSGTSHGKRTSGKMPLANPLKTKICGKKLLTLVRCHNVGIFPRKRPRQLKKQISQARRSL